jgi:hypothetical protein
MLKTSNARDKNCEKIRELRICVTFKSVITAHIFIIVIISRYELGLNRRISAATNTLINRDEIFKKNSRVHFFDHKSYEEILEELNVHVERVDHKLRRYKSHWLRHATRTNNTGCQNVHSYVTYYLVVSLLCYFSLLFLDRTFILVVRFCLKQTTLRTMRSIDVTMYCH